MCSRPSWLLVICLVALVTRAYAGAPALEPRLQRDLQAGPAPILILLEDQADLRRARQARDAGDQGWQVYRALKDHAERTQASLLRLLRGRGLVARSFFAVNAIATTADVGLVRELLARPDVRAVESNATSRWLRPPAEAPTLVPVPESAPAVAGIEWGVSAVSAPPVWDLGFTGQGIVVANADTGMQWDHPALRAHYRGLVGGSVSHDYAWHDAIHDSSGNPCGNDAAAPCDDNGHGTHTTGTVVGDDGQGNQIGVAPGARWIGCRNMDRGNGTPGRYIECFEFFLAPTTIGGKAPNPELRPHVVNNSWGCPASEGCAPDSLRLVIENAQAAGILVEVSAGNSGPGCGTVNDPPAIHQAALSTGAYDSAGRLANFSSRGPVGLDGSGRLKPEISAPGVSVRSSVPKGGYARLSGTSMAGPHVVGVVALLWSARPELLRQIDLTRQILQVAARPGPLVNPGQLCGGLTSDFIPNPSYGYGRVDALRAVQW